MRDICGRYSLSRAVVRRLVSEWRIRAIAAGYIQDIHPETLEALAATDREPTNDENRQGENPVEQWAAELTVDSSVPARVPPPQDAHTRSAT
jgi:hypothetical protein